MAGPDVEDCLLFSELPKEIGFQSLWRPVDPLDGWLPPPIKDVAHREVRGSEIATRVRTKESISGTLTQYCRIAKMAAS